VAPVAPVAQVAPVAPVKSLFKAFLVVPVTRSTYGMTSVDSGVQAVRAEILRSGIVC